uniref:PDZ domain-containing protein n=1 Tax=Peronospora matthiolae TaxID=2874970 RepID=A0AAV1UVF6_9STRA
MAKAIITSILEAQLGKYIDGLRSDSLVVGLWSGELELRDLTLKPHALAELQLPLTVASGSVARVLVRVPWNQLGSASVTITLEGVAALVLPNTERATAAEVLQAKKNQLERRELLRQHGRFAARMAPARQSPHQKAEDESTFASRLTARIVDNLQVTLLGVHVRYEDAVANPDAPFACGLMLERFRYFTTDGEGQEAFVDHTSVHSAFTYKKAELTQFGMYWDRLDTTDDSSRLETDQNIPKVMRKMVDALREEGDEHADMSRRWVLRPCSLMVQLTKNESANYLAVAKYTVEAEIGALQGSLTREQYEDVLFLQRAFLGRRAVEAHFALARGRPLHTPGTRPREWWDYATRLVLEQRRAKLRDQVKGADTLLLHQRRRLHCRKMRWSSIHKAVLEQQLYMESFRAELRNGASLDPSTRQGKFKQRYEEIYPVDVVLHLRDVVEDAEDRARKEAEAFAKAQPKSQDAQNGDGSWYSYFFGGDAVAATGKDNEEEGHVLSAEGRENLREAYDDAVIKASSAHEVPLGCNLVSVQIQLVNGSMALYQSNAHKRPFVIGVFKGSLAVNVQPKDEYDVRLCVQHFDILNGLASNPRFRSFCSPSALPSPMVEQRTACVSIDISRRVMVREAHARSDDDVHATLNVRVSSEPIRVMIDPTFVMFLHAFFVSLLSEKQLEKVWQFATSSVADWMFSDDPTDQTAILQSSSRSAQKEAKEAELMRSLEKAAGRIAYDILVNMNAPVLVLPENIADTTGAVLVIDLGMLSFCNKEKVTPIKKSSDVILGTTADDPHRLHWRLKLTKIYALLGRHEHLVDWTNEELQAFTKIVEDLSVECLFQTQSSSSRLRLPSRGKENVVAVKPLPQVGVHAAIDTITVLLTEKQLVALGRIHSSIIQASTAITRNNRRLSYFVEEELEYDTAESDSISDERPDKVTGAAVTVGEKFLLEMQLSLGCVELNLRESAAKDAFVLRASRISFAVEAYSGHHLYRARLKALIMEDKLYDSNSRFYRLISTGENVNEAPHLIAIDVAAFSADSAETKEQNRRGGPAQLEANVQVNVLHLQWNPSSVALFYRILSGYASAFQPPVDLTPPRERSASSFHRECLLETTSRTRCGEKKERVAMLSSLRSRGQPVIVVRASLVQFSLTLNKDQLDRQLARLDLSNAAVNYTSYMVDGRTSSDDSFEVTGHVGNFVGTDLSTSKHPLYSTLLGLDAGEVCCCSKLGKEVEALLTFEFASDPSASEKSALRLAFQPVRGVYYHQQVLELVDFVFEGVLGAMVSRTLVNATQLILREDEASVVLDLSVLKPTLVLPLSLQDAPHVKVTADVLRLVHFPSSVVHYDESLEARSKRVVHDEDSVRPASGRPVDGAGGIALRVDCKDLFLERVRIFCTATNAGGKTKNADGRPVYEDILPKPAALKISIEDLVSSTICLGDKNLASSDETKAVFLPRLTVSSVLPPLEVHLSRTSYLGIVALILSNFGADELQNNSDATEENERAVSAVRLLGRRRSSTGAGGVPSLRPTVTYTYLQPNADETTFQVQFAMEDVRILLFLDEKVKPLANSDIPVDTIVQHALSDVAQTLRKGAFVEVTASDFSLRFGNEIDKNPCLALRLGAFNARDLVGTCKDSVGDAKSVALLISPQPLEIRYTWDDIALLGELHLICSDVTGTIIPEALFALLGFFTLPSKLSQATNMVGKDLTDPTNEMTSHGACAIPSSTALSTRRESISDILRDGKDPEMAITIRATAKRVGVALPHNVQDPESPRVALAGDFTLEFTWKPRSDSNKEADCGLNIQSRILADVHNVEIVLENARRPGCCVASPSSNAQWDGIDIAPLIQLLEPCSLHMEVSDLFPRAGQQQQIVALSFTPIEVFVSYEDACMAMDTMEFVSEAILRHGKNRSTFNSRQLSRTESSSSRPRARSRTSSRTILGDTAQEKEFHRYFTCKLPSINLTLINDCDGCDMGLAQLQIERCQIFLNLTDVSQAEEHDVAFSSLLEQDWSALPVTTTITGGGSLVVLMSYYNPDTRDWHPMCTEWSLDASVQGSISSESELHVTLTASQSLDLTVTQGLLEVMASVGGAWKRRAASFTAQKLAEGNENEAQERKQRKLAPCVICNETGLPLSFWLTNGSFTTKPQVLSATSSADVRYIHASGRGRGVVRRYASGDRDAANLRLSLQLMDSKSTGGSSVARFQSIQGLILEQLGARTFHLVDTHGQRTSFTLSLSAQLVEGRILLIISSPIKLVNRLTSCRPVALLVNDPTWQSPVEIGILRPNQDSAIPVLLSLASELRLRPAEDGASYSWSAPIPLQTLSAVELKVQAAASFASSGSGVSVVNKCNRQNAVYCVSILSDKEMRALVVAEPLILINKLPVRLTYRVRSAMSSAYGLGVSDSPSEPETIAVGGKASIWWTDISQRPLFQLLVEGCTLPSKWLELAPRGTASGAVLSVQLFRVDDGRLFRLLLRVVGDTDHASRPIRVEFLSDIWVINRTGLELVYGTASDSEAYIPPRAARAQVGNAQISAYSSDSSGKVPVVRVGLRGCTWSARFEADPKRLSWQDECITLRSASGSLSSGDVLYELGVSADYATRHFGSVTTLVSVIPRYLIFNQSSHTLLLRETSSRQHEQLEDSSNDNVAHHVLGAKDMYALYWVGGARALLRASVLLDHDTDTLCGEGYDWSATFAVYRVGTVDLLVPPRSSGRGVRLRVAVKRGSLSQASFVVVVTNMVTSSPTSSSSRLSSAGLAFSPSARDTVASTGTAKWQTFSLHAHMAGIIVTVTDKKQAGMVEESQSLFAGESEGASELVARATFTSVGVEASWSSQATAAKLTLAGLKVEDLLPRSKNRVVLRPLLQGDSTLGPVKGRRDKHFLELTYLERPHAKYTWVERVRVELQNMKVSTSTRFVDRLNKLQQKTVAHFQHKSLVSAFPDEHISNGDDDDECDLLAYFTHQETGEECTSVVDMASMTGRKLYIASGEISPVRVLVSFARNKSDSSRRGNNGFWLSNLKIKIENACVTLEGYRLSHALATPESLSSSIMRFYEQSVKSQALNLIDSIEVTSLVTSMVTGGVTSLVSTLRGRADPAAAAGAVAPGLLTSDSLNANSSSSLAVPFRFENLSNDEIVRKHSRALDKCRCNTDFLRQVRHLVYDWDANHTGLEARGCVALALINNSRHSLVMNTKLNDGASLRALPIGRQHLASILDASSEVGTASAAGGSATSWRSDRALVVFAYGYTPTLLTSGDVYFTVQSNACNIYATRKTARLKANRGYTATFTLQEAQTWWSVNVVIISDDLQDNDNSVTATTSDTLFGEAPAASELEAASTGGDDEFEVEFSGTSLGLVAEQTGRSVVVRECVPSSAAAISGRIAVGDYVVAVNGMSVANTAQFKSLVSKTPRPIVLRFRRKCNAAYDLFGERAREDGGNDLFG